MAGSFVQFSLDPQLGSGPGFPVDPGTCEKRQRSLGKDVRRETEVRQVRERHCRQTRGKMNY